MSFKQRVESNEPIPLEELRQTATSTSRLEKTVAARAYTDHWARITPPPHPPEVVAYLIDYYFERMETEYLPEAADDPEDAQEYIDSRFEAAYALRWLFESRFDQGDRSTVEKLVERVTQMFRDGDRVLRNIIETGFLEHLLERKDLVPFFEFWKSDSALSEAFAYAHEWGQNHSRD